MKWYRFYFKNMYPSYLVFKGEYGPTTRENVEKFISNGFLLTPRELDPFPLPSYAYQILAVEELA